MIPAIEMNEAADIQSAAVANPFANGDTPPPATKNSFVEPALDQMAIPIYKEKVTPTKIHVHI